MQSPLVVWRSTEIPHCIYVYLLLLYMPIVIIFTLFKNHQFKITIVMVLYIMYHHHRVEGV